MSRSLVPLSLAIFGFFAASSVAAEETNAFQAADTSSVVSAMDRLKCTGESATATASMIIRQFDNPGELSKAEADIAANGEWREEDHYSLSYYIKLAFAEDIARDKDRQKAEFAESAKSACQQRLAEKY